MQDLLYGYQRPAGSALIAIVSRSASIRQWASTLLSALGFSADSVILRDPVESGWREGLGACDIVAADILAAAQLKDSAESLPLTFRLVSPDFLSELDVAMRSSENGLDTG